MQNNGHSKYKGSDQDNCVRKNVNIGYTLHSTMVRDLAIKLWRYEGAITECHSGNYLGDENI